MLTIIGKKETNSGKTEYGKPDEFGNARQLDHFTTPLISKRNILVPPSHKFPAREPPDEGYGL